ncbi:MAG: hypothetical protein LH619_14255 [Chitinophagaceae bacterium]|nr:hypothetical protein [Chitinophagaceae bacterium]
MRNLFLTGGVLLMLITSCKKQTELVTAEPETQLQQKPFCGMEEAMANMLPEYRNAMSRTETTTPATELLLFLDFDGAMVLPGHGTAQGGNVTSPIVRFRHDVPSPTLSPAQIEEIIQLVKDDFSPFNIQVTTSQAVYDAYLRSNKQVCIITKTPGHVGFRNALAGVSPWAGLGYRLADNPCFVFADPIGSDLKLIALVISHEVGHTMGLGHQGQYDEECRFYSDYNGGFGTGPLSFVPIMGMSRKRISNWFAQPCLVPYYSIPQNDFVFLNNQVELREDDFPNSPTGNKTNTAPEINGILEQDGDVDFIRINFKNPGPVTITSENIDIKASLYLPNGQLIAEYENPDDTHVIIPSANGMRYLKIEAVSNANMSSQFMTGMYKIKY